MIVLDDEFVIGRAESGVGQLGDDPELSRRHAVVDARRLRSAGDRGPRLGQRDVRERGRASGERQVLAVGNKVRVGKTTLELTAGERARRPAAPAAAPPPPRRRHPLRRAPPLRLPLLRRRPPLRRPAAAPRPPSPPTPAPAPPPPVPSRAPRRYPPDPPPPGRHSPAGTVIAGCRIEEVIGHGDMGIIYQAEELALQRHVALKLIRPEHSGEQRYRERFRRESMVAASIDHPNVIPILEAGDEEGMLFIRHAPGRGHRAAGLIAAEGPARSAARGAHRQPGRLGSRRRPLARARPPGRQARQRAARPRPITCT